MRMAMALGVLVCLEGAGQAQVATYYGKEFAGHRTASGERFNPRAMTAAANEKTIGGIVKYCGIALQKRDSSLVSFTDKEEVARVKLGLTKAPKLNAWHRAISEQTSECD